MLPQFLSAFSLGALKSKNLTQDKDDMPTPLNPGLNSSNENSVEVASASPSSITSKKLSISKLHKNIGGWITPDRMGLIAYFLLLVAAIVSSMLVLFLPQPSYAASTALSSSEIYQSSNYEDLSPKPGLGVIDPQMQDKHSMPNKEEKSYKEQESKKTEKSARGQLSHHPAEPLLTPEELDKTLDTYQVVGKIFTPSCEEAQKSSGQKICMKDLESYFENKNVRLRVLPQNVMTTQEYSMNRLNFQLDKNNKIISVNMG